MGGARITVEYGVRFGNERDATEDHRFAVQFVLDDAGNLRGRYVDHVTFEGEGPWGDRYPTGDPDQFAALVAIRGVLESYAPAGALTGDAV